MQCRWSDIRRLRITIGVAVLAAGPACAPPHRTAGQSSDSVVTQKSARALVISTLTPVAQHFPNVRFDAEHALQNGDRFYVYEVTASVPDDASPVLGHFAVNKVTGDVWDASKCIKLSSKSIESFQALLRENMHISVQQFH